MALCTVFGDTPAMGELILGKIRQCVVRLSLDISQNKGLDYRPARGLEERRYDELC